MDKKNGVYKINCKNCSSWYIGKTKRRCNARIKEHQAACSKVKRKKKLIRDEKHDNGLPFHALSLKHVFDFDKVEILAVEQSFTRRRLLEAMHIQLNSNTCNLQVGKRFDENWKSFFQFFMKQKRFPQAQEELMDLRSGEERILILEEDESNLG